MCCLTKEQFSLLSLFTSVGLFFHKVQLNHQIMSEISTSYVKRIVGNCVKMPSELFDTIVVSEIPQQVSLLLFMYYLRIFRWTPIWMCFYWPSIIPGTSHEHSHNMRWPFHIWYPSVSLDNHDTWSCSWKVRFIFLNYMCVWKTMSTTRKTSLKMLPFFALCDVISSWSKWIKLFQVLVKIANVSSVLTRQ